MFVLIYPREERRVGAVICRRVSHHQDKTAQLRTPRRGQTGLRQKQLLASVHSVGS